MSCKQEYASQHMQDISVRVWAKERCNCPCVVRTRTFRVHATYAQRLVSAFAQAFEAERLAARQGSCRAIREIGGQQWRAKRNGGCGGITQCVEKMRRDAKCCERCLSSHAMGIALDISHEYNRQYFPDSEGRILRNPYLDDQRYECYALREGDAIVRALEAAGLQWGGRWRSQHDYMHFSGGE